MVRSGYYAGAGPGPGRPVSAPLQPYPPQPLPQPIMQHPPRNIIPMMPPSHAIQRHMGGIGAMGMRRR